MRRTKGAAMASNATMTMRTQSAASSSAAASSPPPRNPFQKTGTDAPYELKETKKECVVRVDMPGCPESDLVYWIDGNAVHFFADEPPAVDREFSGRKYGGSMVFNPQLYDVKETKASLLHGVLWISVPKLPK